MYKKLVIIFMCVTIGFCEDSTDITRKCGDSIKCVEDEVVRLIDEICQEEKVKILGDFAILEKSNDVAVQARADEGVVDRLIRFVSNHQLKLKLPSSEEDISKIIQETRSSKLKKLIIPLVILLKLKAAIIIPAILSGIALVAFKGLGASLIALAISGAIAFKSLLESHKHSKFTYEVVPPHSHWSRSGVAGIEAYPVPGYHTIPQLYK